MTNAPNPGGKNIASKNIQLMLYKKQQPIHNWTQNEHTSNFIQKNKNDDP